MKLRAIHTQKKDINIESFHARTDNDDDGS